MIIFVLLFNKKTTTQIYWFPKKLIFSKKMLYLLLKLIICLINYAKLLKTTIQKTVFIDFDR